MKIINKISQILDVAGRAIFTLLIITMAIVMWAVAIFGGSVTIEINNPFWDNKETTK